MYASSHQPFLTGSYRTEDGRRIRRQRPSRQVQLRRALAEQTETRR
jgi:hypothetical protein